MKQLEKKAIMRLFKTMLRIRMVEERIAELYPNGLIRTPVHFSIGQEAVASGVCAALEASDPVFASHRCHAAYLAKGGSLKGMLAELFGRVSGACCGRSGSAHLSSPEINMYSAPILGELIAVAAGAGLAFKLAKNKKVAVAFFGDAAVEEGVFWETINFAVVKKLPVVFICENNFYSTHTHIRFRQPGIPIYQRAGAQGIQAKKINGNDVLEVYIAAKEAVNLCRKGIGPFFLECTTYRFREHVGPNFDFNNPYRSRKEVESWMEKCPVRKLEEFLLLRKIIDVKELNSLKNNFSSQIEQAIVYAQKSPWPDKYSLICDVY